MKIEQIRISRNLSQEQLAEISGLNVRTIQRLEKGSKPSVESLKCLACALDVEISDISETRTEEAQSQNKPNSSVSYILLAIASIFVLFGAKSEVGNPEIGAFFYFCAAVCFFVTTLIMFKARMGRF